MRRQLIGRDDETFGAVAFAGEPCLAGPHLIEALGVNGEACPQNGLVEPHQRVAGANVVAFADEQCSDDATRKMLHFLDAGISDDRAEAVTAPDNSVIGGPTADPGGRDECNDCASDQMIAQRAVFATCGSVGHVDAAD